MPMGGETDSLEPTLVGREIGSGARAKVHLDGAKTPAVPIGLRATHSLPRRVPSNAPSLSKGREARKSAAAIAAKWISWLGGGDRSHPAEGAGSALGEPPYLSSTPLRMRGRRGSR